MHASVAAVKAVDPGILVEQAAGITRADQVYRYILAGADGVGAASGVAAAADPAAKAREMIAAVARARDDRAAHEREGLVGA